MYRNPNLRVFPTMEISDEYILREQTMEDLDDFYYYFTDPTVSKYILSSIPKDLTEAREELAYWISLFNRNTGIYWAIAEKSTNKMIGAIGFHDWNRFNNRIEVSYDLSKDYWQKGIMTIAMKKVMDYAFRVLRVNRIQASTIKENTGSIKLLEKCNFQKDGTLRQYRHHNNRFYDIEMYSYLASDLS